MQIVLDHVCGVQAKRLGPLGRLRVGAPAQGRARGHPDMVPPGILQSHVAQHVWAPTQGHSASPSW
eukprot:3607347-Lingulodinium_polyedra.AAC.1